MAYPHEMRQTGSNFWIHTACIVRNFEIMLLKHIWLVCGDKLWLPRYDWWTG